MKVVYVAGKYRGPNAWAVEGNIRHASQFAAQVWSFGIAALCPHTNSAHMEGIADDAMFLAGTLEMMRRCDAVLLIPGWQDSAGARAEAAEADRLGIPVFVAETPHDVHAACAVLSAMEPAFRFKPHAQGYSAGLAPRA